MPDETKADEAKEVEGQEGQEEEKPSQPEINPQETRDALIKAKKEYPKGLVFIFEFGKEILRGNAIFHAAYAAEKIKKDCVKTVITEYYQKYELGAMDIAHATESLKRHKADATVAALDLGFRRTDIPYAAGSFAFWPKFKDGVAAMTAMVKMFKKVRADVNEADIRYAAMTLRNLDMDVLERAIRDRHPKNEREPWARGASIPIIAYCYKLSAPHTGAAIDACRDNHVRREKVGHEVLGALGRKFGKSLSPPNWMS